MTRSGSSCRWATREDSGSLAASGGGPVRLAVLYTSLDHTDWPDYLDVENGLFTYFGDNRKPGKRLHDTSRGGNTLLRDAFGATHGDPARREEVPPIFVFGKGPRGRDVQFRGLAVPGGIALAGGEDLVAIWRTVRGQRFQNYKATFTVLKVGEISRAWIGDVLDGNPMSPNAPRVWRRWVRSGVYTPLTAPKVTWRTKAEQLPQSPADAAIIEAVYQHFASDAYAFEECAAELVRMMDSNVVECDVTRRWRDGGRDALGKYKIGPPAEVLKVDFAVEAKRYALTTGVGVKETSRLISRLRYRQFGVFVTTSYIGDQAYREIKEDGHPVIVVSARDIVDILKANGLTTAETVRAWLVAKFPII